MTVREIEETLHTLEQRHPGLNEVMLVTLLRAGGWEDRDVEEARIVFRNTPPVPPTAKLELEKHNELPPIQEAPVFRPVPDTEHTLPQPEVDLPKSVPSLTKEPEQESLLPDAGQIVSASREELPHNLPLRPFETSDHVWSFARYRDVFYGEEDASQKPLTKTDMRRPIFSGPQSVPLQNTSPAQPAVAIDREKIEQNILNNSLGVAPHHPPAPEIQKTVVIEERGDEKLVVLASVMLIAILLLLGYMYGNGRL